MARSLRDIDVDVRKLVRDLEVMLRRDDDYQDRPNELLAPDELRKLREARDQIDRMFCAQARLQLDQQLLDTLMSLDDDLERPEFTHRIIRRMRQHVDEDKRQRDEQIRKLEQLCSTMRHDE
jgi:hypothetical protein